MPIYAYRCESCGHAKDVLQKVSDPLLTTCPACHAESFKKQLTAAGFQLKGSGWYVTDFRGGNNGAKPEAANGAAAVAPKVDAPAAEGAKTDPAPASSGSSEAASTTASTSSSSSDSGSTPAAGCGGSCACH
jgi:putative FmdB family regulatory protein